MGGSGGDGRKGRGETHPKRSRRRDKWNMMLQKKVSGVPFTRGKMLKGPPRRQGEREKTPVTRGVGDNLQDSYSQGRSVL